MASEPLVALSPDGKRLACILNPPRGGDESASSSSLLRALLFDVESGSLQTTLTHRNSSSNNNDDDDETAPALAVNPLKLLFVGPDMLAVLFSSHLLAWDLNRGVVAYTLHAKPLSAFYDVAAAAATTNSSDGHNYLSLYILVSATDSAKVQIHQFHATTGKMERKVKAGKGGGAHGLAVTKEKYLVIRHEDGLRVLNQSTGHKVSKCGSLVLETTRGGTSTCDTVATCRDDDTLAATISQGQIVLVDLESGKKQASIPLDKSSATSSFQFWQQDKDTALLLQGETLHKVSLDTRQVVKTWSCPLDGSLEQQFRVGHGSVLVGLLIKDGQHQVVVEDVDEMSDKIRVAWKKSPEELSSQKDKKKNKRKESPNKQQQQQLKETVLLGPAHVGGEAMASEGPASKKSRLEQMDEDNEDEDGNDDDNDAHPTVGERLQQLQQALDEEDAAEEEARNNINTGNDNDDTAGFAPKQATTESLGKLLTQGLQSGEDRLLELALNVRNPVILKETCQELPDDLLPRLLNAVTSRLAGKGRPDFLCPWISVLVKSGRIKSLAHLQPLRNLIQERIEVFPELLQLQGRLSLITKSNG